MTYLQVRLLTCGQHKIVITFSQVFQAKNQPIFSKSWYSSTMTSRVEYFSPHGGTYFLKNLLSYTSSVDFSQLRRGSASFKISY